MSISRLLARSVSNYNSPTSLGSRLRTRRIGPLLAMVDAVFVAKGTVSIVDVGGTAGYWNIVPRDYLAARNVTITLVNLPAEASPASPDSDRFRFVAADGCDLACFPDNAFDIAHSNSVLEHVGPWPRMERFAAEISRLAPRLFVQTPNFWFPLEPHAMTPFIHWLPRPLRIWLVRHFQLGHWPRAALRRPGRPHRRQRNPAVSPPVPPPVPRRPHHHRTPAAPAQVLHRHPRIAARARVPCFRLAEACVYAPQSPGATEECA